jgi:hypothetical protein
MTPDNNGGFFEKGSGDEAAYQSELRVTFGAEDAERVRREQALHAHPRPLTESERAVLRETLDPVLRDMTASGAVLPAVREEAHEDLGNEALSAWIEGEGASGQGCRIWLTNSAAERLVDLADQFQEWEVEELCAVGRPATWPECPEHPNSHPLEPVLDANQAAVWRCPRSRHVICPIGDLRR